MQPNPNDPMNSLMRRAGNRSRSLPNIGQTPLAGTPAVQVANAAAQMPGQQPAPMGQMPGTQPQALQTPQTASPQPQQSPLAAPAVQPATFTIHPPGTPADNTQYNYEPQPDGAWRVYPPGVQAPNHMLQASMSKAASSADYARMRQAFQQGAPQ